MTRIRLGGTGRGLAWSGEARRSGARPRLGTAWQGRAGPGSARRGVDAARQIPGAARRGSGEVRCGAVRLGEAGRGSAWRGKVRSGRDLAREGRTMVQRCWCRIEMH